MKKILALGLGLILLNGCSTVKGIVRDKNTTSPVASAVVTNTRINATATTNSIGKYTLNGLHLSGDTLMVNAPGYNIYTATITDPNQILDIELVKQK